MKTKVIMVIALTCSLNAFGADSVSGEVAVDTKDVSARISVAGKGNSVCASVNSSSHKVYLARGRTDHSSMASAKNACLADGGSIFCKEYTCENDRSESNSNLDVVFDVLRKDAVVSIYFSSGDVSYECVGANSVSKISYIASAPTRLEASALVANLCLDDGGSIFCDEIDEVKCSQTEGVEAEIDIEKGFKRGLKGILNGILNKN